MCTIRCFEESVKKDFLNGEIPGFVHLYIGEEAIATGVCAALRKTDFVESTHRGHGHCIAKGADVNKMMAEIDEKIAEANRQKEAIDRRPSRKNRRRKPRR